MARPTRRDDVTLRRVHGQGQRALPHRELPRTLIGSTSAARRARRQERALEAGRRAEGLQLARLLRRQVLHLAEARRVHGPGAGAAAAPTTGAGTSPPTRRRPPTPTFTWEQFQAQVNADLADVLGNFVNRILKFTETPLRGRRPRRAASRRPAGGEARTPTCWPSCASSPSTWRAASSARPSTALRQLWVLGNEYLTEAAPWTAIKTDPDRAAVAVRTGLNLVALFAKVSEPVHPVRGRDDRAVGRRGFPGRGRRLTARALLDVLRARPRGQGARRAVPQGRGRPGRRMARALRRPGGGASA